MCGGECGIIPHPLVGYVIKLQLVVQRFAVNAQQLCSAALVVSRLPQGFDDLMLLCLLIAERDTDDAGAGPFSSFSSLIVMNLPCASKVARRTIFFIWRRLPGQGYSNRARDALSSKPVSCLSISRLAWSRKKLAKSRMSSRRSLSCGIRR